MSQQNSKIDPSKWLDTHGDVLYAYAMSRLRNQDAAEEAVQETFLGALRNQGTHTGQSSEGAWLMGILKKKVVDRIRANSKRAASLESEDQVVSRLFDENGNWSDAARKADSLKLDSIEQGEFREIFELCLQGLPESQAAVFVLKEVHQDSSENVCKELGISSTNLWVLMHRARLRLAECIKTRWAMGDA